MLPCTAKSEPYGTIVDVLLLSNEKLPSATTLFTVMKILDTTMAAPAAVSGMMTAGRVLPPVTSIVTLSNDDEDVTMVMLGKSLRNTDGNTVTSLVQFVKVYDVFDEILKSDVELQGSSSAEPQQINSINATPTETQKFCCCSIYFFFETLVCALPVTVSLTHNRIACIVVFECLSFSAENVK